MIYLDNAATTRVCPEAVLAMRPYFEEQYGNPSALYAMGRTAGEALRRAREEISAILGARPEEVVFTSGGTESDNWALTAVFEANCARGNHVITSRIEHPAVLRTCEYLARERGARITYLEPGENGIIDPREAEAAICSDTILLSVMAANNETGVLQPLKELGDAAHRHNILFHTDAVQAFGHIPLDVDELQADLLSASGHKFGGPKGCGFLYIRKGCGIGSMIRGGEQEFHRRAGTENVPAVAGMAAAAAAASEHMQERMRYEKELRDYMIGRLCGEIPGTVLNGHPERRLPGNVNCRFTGTFTDITAEEILIMLDMRGIAASAGSACSAGAMNPSHVLLAMGLTEQEARRSVRFTLSHETKRAEIDQTVDALKQILEV